MGELKLEAQTGLEPACNGFADRSLTTWVPRRRGLYAAGTKGMSTVG